LPWVKDVPRGLTNFIGVAELLGGLGLLLLAAFVAYGRFVLLPL
jgi:hypothetical protein